MSSHAVEVVPVTLEKHPDADSLSVVRIRGFTVCIRTADWKDGDLGAYIPPDSVVDSARPEFAFLAGHERIRVRRMRGVVSMGLLVKAPPGLAVGADAAEALGVTHYEPPLQATTGGEAEAPPQGIHAPGFDVENLRRYPDIFTPGEPVEVTEKIHGACGRFLSWEGRLWAGSRTEWKRPGEATPSIWWAALDGSAEARKWLEAHPGMVVYGEVYGRVQDLKYGVQGVRIAAFDILDGRTGDWWEAGRAEGTGLPWVPRIFQGPFVMETVLGHAEGKSLVPGANHLREGCVVRPLRERRHPEIGRVILKAVGNGYMERKE